MLDPRTKFILIVLINILYFSAGSTIFVTIANLTAIILLFSHKQEKIALISCGVLIFLEIMTGIMPFLPVFISNILSNFLLSLLVFFSLYIYPALFITTTQMGESISDFSKWHLPKEIFVPFIVLVRFFPTLKVEFENIQNSMKLRGRSSNLVQKITNIYVPILFCSVRTGEMLTIAATTKGMGLPNEMTITRESKMKLQDYVIILFMILLILSKRMGVFM